MPGTAGSIDTELRTLSRQVAVIGEKLDTLDQRCERIERHAEHTNGSIAELDRWRIAQDATEAERRRVADLGDRKAVVEHQQRGYALSRTQLRLYGASISVGAAGVLAAVLTSLHVI